jgi:hypothetical protein
MERRQQRQRLTNLNSILLRTLRDGCITTYNDVYLPLLLLARPVPVTVVIAHFIPSLTGTPNLRITIRLRLVI